MERLLQFERIKETTFAITMHQEVLTLIDTQLLPSATDTDLKALTATIRASVAMHLQTAQTIFATL